MPFVLVVDDDPIIRENLCDLFAGEYFCQSAATAEEALTMMNSERFDVVVTDISMPGMSGVELFGQIRQRQPDTPVIVLSGIGDQAYRTGLLSLGAYAYHFKPYKREEIEATVASAIEHHRRLHGASAHVELGAGQDRDDAVERTRGSTVDRDDAAVRDVAAYEARVQHSGEHHVVEQHVTETLRIA